MKTDAAAAGPVSPVGTPWTSLPGESEARPALPVTQILNVPRNVSPDDGDEAGQFFDARDNQCWLPPQARQSSAWPQLTSLAAQVGDAIHYQLGMLSRTALASGLLNVIHPDLSKLLAAVLICSRQGQDILWQAGLTGGLELLSTLIRLSAGTGSAAALLSALPRLLIIWLNRQHISPGATLTETLSLLLATGLNICACEDLAQPAWLLKLDDEVFMPLRRLGSETGITEALTAGATLLLGLYTMLRLTGWLEGKAPPPNALAHGMRIIHDIGSLSATSQEFQRLYLIKNKQQQTRHWYERTHHQPYQENKAAKAISRSVVRCLPPETLRLKDAAETTESFTQAYQETERQILTGQLTRCPSGKGVLPPGHRDPAAVRAAVSSPSARAATSVPLLASGVMAAGIAAQHSGWPGRPTWLLAAAGATLLATSGIRYSLSPQAISASPQLPEVSVPGNLCLIGTIKVRQFLRSDKTGVPLAIELINVLFDRYGDLNFNRADQLLTSWNITQFSSRDRLNMNNHLLYILSLLLSPNDKDEPIDFSKFIYKMKNTINFVWSMMINDKKNYSASQVLKKLRIRCNNLYIKLGVSSQTGMRPVTDFLLSIISPDLLILERNGKGWVKIISNDMYYLWNYISNHLSDNQYIMNSEFYTAISEGRMDSFVISRIRNYPIYTITKKREVLESIFEKYNRAMYEYHKLDVRLEAISIITFDSVIQAEYPDIDLHERILFDVDYLLIHTKSPFGEEARTLLHCETYRDIIRNFEDGFAVLDRFLSKKIPQSLRNYSTTDKKSFTLKAHPKLSELYQNFDQSYQLMTDRLCELYGDIVKKAYEILPDEEKDFLKNPATEIYLIVLEAKRFKMLRYIFFPKYFRLNHQLINQPYYNTRRYYETGTFFSAYNSISKEKRFYDIDIEYSRKKSREYPIRRLDINSSEEFINLDPAVLNRHYIFSDGEPLILRCNEIRPPVIISSTHWEQLKEFSTKYYEFYKNSVCETFTSPIDTLVFFNEIRLGDDNTTAIEALTNVTINHRRKLLTYQKEISLNRTTIEQEKAKGKVQQLLEFLPLSSCVSFARDLIFKTEDISPSSTAVSVYEAITCAADLYTAYGARKTLAKLVKSLRDKYATYWLKKSSVKKLHDEIINMPSTSRGHPQSVLDKISEENENIRLLEIKIEESQKEIYRAMGELISVPVFTAFPLLSFKSGEEFIFSNIPWGVNLIKMYSKSNIQYLRNQDIQVPWSNPQADTMLLEEMDPVKPNSTSKLICHDTISQPNNIILDIFDLRRADPAVFQHLFFTALRAPYPNAIISTAEDKGWIIPTSYNQMAMFCFISLTILARHYTGTTLALEEYYKTDRNDIKITEEALYQYYADHLVRPYIPFPVNLQKVQEELVNQSIITIASLLESNLQGIERNYLFMVHYLLMKEDVETLLQEINSKPEDKPAVQVRILHNLSWNLEKLTIYSSRNSLSQKKFLEAIIDHYINFCQHLSTINPANIMLFSPNSEIFLVRQQNFLRQHPAATLPLLEDFASNWLQMAKNISDIYQSFSRIEYSAKALDNFTPDRWSSEDALDAWHAELKHYLLPEMHYEDLDPVLLNATQELSEYWRQRLKTTNCKLKIVEKGSVNPLFIEDVKTALKKSCANHPELFFSNFYQIDDGNWFTFLTNDFISNKNHKRSYRHARTHSAYLPWPLAPLYRPSLEEMVALPLRQRLAIWRPALNITNAQLYQRQLSSIPASFDRFASHPFHQRLYGHLLDDFPLPESVTLRQVAMLINNMIDEHGNIVDYQIKVISRYLSQLNLADNYLLLQLLSDIFQLAAPQAPPLYPFIFHLLQNKLTQPQVRLSTLSQGELVASLVTEIYQLYLPEVQHPAAATQLALRRYITATLRHLLSFASYLSDIESLLATEPLQSLSSKWLCLGAIITRQLRLPTTSTNELLQLAQAAFGDAGLLSFSDTAIQQAALFSGQGRAVHNALKTIASGVQQAAEMQQLVLNCIMSNQQLRTFLTELTFSGLMPGQGLQLNTLITTCLNEQRQLMQFSFMQLSSPHIHSLVQALKEKKLRFSWYLEWCNNDQNVRVAGVAFHLNNQPGFLLPLADPQSIPLIFRQLSPLPSDSELAQLCFGTSRINHKLADPVEVVLPVGQDPLSQMSALMQSMITARLNPLEQAGSDAEFRLRKERLESWLNQYLFFYGLSDEDDNGFIPEQAEHLTIVAAHPILQSWLQPDEKASVASSAVSDFARAISDVMDARTGWPALTDGLREIPQRVGPISLASLPAYLFAGFWWDPVSRFCYLGWKVGSQRNLYASLAGDRHHIYPLPDDEASTSIWQQLIIHDWLKESLRELQYGRLSAETFFSYSIPLTWQLQCAVAEAPPLPAKVIPHTGLTGLYYTGSDKQRRYYYSPGITHRALPVTLAPLSGGGYRLEFSPRDDSASPDLAFTLEMKQEAPSRPDEGRFHTTQLWQLAAASQASRLIAEGNFSPASYLQWTAPTHSATMIPLPHVLLRNDGNIVFIFSENNWRRISYRIPDAEGRLQPSPTVPASWPRDITAVNEQQFNATVERFFLQQKSPDYWLFPQAVEQQSAEAELSRIHHTRRAKVVAAAETMHMIPFRFTENNEVVDELFEINLHFRRQNQHFYDVVKTNAGLENTEITLGDLQFKLLDWRQSDLSQQTGRNEAQKAIALKKQLLDSMLSLLLENHALEYSTPGLQEWIQRSLDILQHTRTAIEFIQVCPPPLNADDAFSRLQQQRFAQNYFFGYYGEQLHATADFFQQRWQYVRDNSGLTPLRWQRTLDQLHTLTSSLPADMQQLDRLLTLPEVLWKTAEMQQRARHWQQLCHSASGYWQTPHYAEQIILLRPKASEQGLNYIPQKYHWPVQLILAAGLGAPPGNKDDGIAEPLRISVEQNDDLLLTRSRPDTANTATLRFAGTNSQPCDARGLAEQAKLRLSSPWALREFSGPDFLARLQQRIQLVTDQESEHWSQQESDFYRSAETRLFLQQELEQQPDRQLYRLFFQQLFDSNLLVTRLIMTDAEMIFGLLCDRFVERYPQRASEDLSAAWFLFMQIFENQHNVDPQQPLWLVGV